MRYVEALDIRQLVQIVTDLSASPSSQFGGRRFGKPISLLEACEGTRQEGVPDLRCDLKKCRRRGDGSDGSKSSRSKQASSRFTRMCRWFSVKVNITGESKYLKRCRSAMSQVDSFKVRGLNMKAWCTWVGGKAQWEELCGGLARDTNR